MAIVPSSGLRLYEFRSLLEQEAASGTGSESFYVIAGSRLLLTLSVLSLSSGGSVKIYVDNTYSEDDGYVLLDTIEASATGQIRRPLTDFNRIFRLRYEVTGTATFKVGGIVYDNASNVQLSGVTVNADISGVADGNGDYDSIRITDGAYNQAINPDGSTNVVIVGADDEGAPASPYDTAVGVLSGVETTILQYEVPADKTATIYRCEASGENIARFQILLNGDAIATRRTHHGSGLTTEFDFTTPSKNSLTFQPGDIVRVNVLHIRPMAGDFESRLQLLLKDLP